MKKKKMIVAVVVVIVIAVLISMWGLSKGNQNNNSLNANLKETRENQESKSEEISQDIAVETALEEKTSLDLESQSMEINDGEDKSNKKDKEKTTVTESKEEISEESTIHYTAPEESSHELIIDKDERGYDSHDGVEYGGGKGVFK